MKHSAALLLRGASWTIGAYAASQLFRFCSNIVLTHLLAPELFGIIAIVYSITTGIHLMSDVGIGQNIVYNKNADQSDFYNTAWTLQLLRGLLLWAVSLAAAPLLAHFYQLSLLAYLLPVASLSFVLTGLSSTGRYLAQKRLQFVRINIFDGLSDFVSAAANIVAALITPTVWAFIFGLLAAQIVRTAGSYFLVPNVRHKIYISKDYARSIVAYSKWIFLSSIAFFLAMNFDNLYLGKASTLALLGVYGVAKTLSQQIVALSSRLSATFVFPIISSSNELERSKLRQEVVNVRGIFLSAIAVALSIIAVGGDAIVALLYDVRYQAAGWMLPLLVVGAWFSILCTVNESILLGLGKPTYAAIGNFVKFGWLLAAIPFGYIQFGTFGFVVAIAASDLVRYIPVSIGQAKEGMSFRIQDLAITLAAIGLMAVWELLRWALGVGFTGL